MTPAPLHLAGQRLLLDPAGVLVWPETGLLAVADLHLEKGTASAAQGRLVPPWDTRATLERLALALRRYRPRIVVALGDSFHDVRGHGRMAAADSARLAALTASARFIWVLGNHDPVPPEGAGGDAVEEFAAGPLTFRHIARAAPPPPGFAGEISGHYHPKARVPTRAGGVSRPCFIADTRRVVLPSFGTYTGGLDVQNPALASLFPRGGRIFLLGRDRLFSFTLGQV